jgi:glutamine synthetase adenylyltransferase
MRHGARHPGLRRANTLQAIREIAAVGLLPAADCATLAEQYRVLRRVSLGLRLFGTRPSDTLELAGPNPARLAKTLEYPSRKDFLEDYRRRTAWGLRALRSRRAEVSRLRQAPGSRVMRAPSERRRSSIRS